MSKGTVHQVISAYNRFGVEAVETKKKRGSFVLRGTKQEKVVYEK